MHPIAEKPSRPDINSDETSKTTIRLFIALCVLGCGLRIFHYVINRSLWLDEAMLALNIANRGFVSLLKPLDFDQGAPILFLWLQKAVVTVLTVKDYTLRLIPLIAGVASIFLMRRVCRCLVPVRSSVVAIALIALSPTLIYYSSEVKQYSSDVAIGLSLLLLGTKCLRDNPSQRSFVWLGIGGAIAIWFSHPSLFIFAGILLTLGVRAILRRDMRVLALTAATGLVYGISFGLDYWISLRQLAANSYLKSYWSESLAPTSVFDAKWYLNVIGGMFNDPGVLPAILPLNILLFVFGIVTAIKRNRWFTMFLIAPIVFCLAAAVLGKYPFSGRLLLFLLPFLFLLLAFGVEGISDWCEARSKTRVSRFVFLGLAMYLLMGFTTTDVRNVIQPPLKEHIKPVLSYLKEKRQPSDPIYVYYGAKPAGAFYGPDYGLDPASYTVGKSARDEPAEYLKEITMFRGNPRFWIIFSHNCEWCVLNEKEFILYHLQRIGRELDSYSASGASVYLFDLTERQQ